jgi:hypothetical protein
MSRMSELHAQLSEVLPDVIECTIQTGGASRNLRNESPTAGFMVGGKAPASIAPIGSDGDREAFVSALLEFADTNLASLAGGSWLGTWVDDGSVYIELVDMVGSVRDAVLLGMDRRELAIWDVVEAREIRLAGPAQACEWFALCDRFATVNVPHPVLGSVPTCARCYKNNVTACGRSAFGYEHTSTSN